MNRSLLILKLSFQHSKRLKDLRLIFKIQIKSLKVMIIFDLNICQTLHPLILLLNGTPQIEHQIKLRKDCLRGQTLNQSIHKNTTLKNTDSPQVCKTFKS